MRFISHREDGALIPLSWDGVRTVGRSFLEKKIARNWAYALTASKILRQQIYTITPIISAQNVESRFSVSETIIRMISQWPNSKNFLGTACL